MPRDIPLANGHLLVCFDGSYQIRDLYFPHVGQENHLGGEPMRFGVWVDGRFSWVSDDGWRREMAYDDDTMVTRIALYHPGFKLMVHCRDAVDFHENVLVREAEVENLEHHPRKVRLFFTHGFNISGNSVGDTAAFDPESGGVVHYKGARYFLANGRSAGRPPFAWAVGQKRVNGREGTWRDAEDGELSGNPIAQGSVDSVLGFEAEVGAQGRATVFYWLAAGESWADVRRLDRIVQKKSPGALLKRSGDYWRLWVRKESPPLDLLPGKVAELFRRSLLVLRTQIDWQGGILAANDSDVIMFNRDTYSYVWPRDGALVANALDLAGYPMPAQAFFRFASSVMEREGYFLHKYNPDGTLASSWHPWVEAGRPQLPIQEDETALVIWALWQHFVLYRDIEFVKPLYRPLVKNGADFLCAFRDEGTGLPAPSYDLWEERRGISAFTTGAVFGGLTAASLFCTVFGEEDRAERYRRCAGEIRDAASSHLWRQDLGRFCRMLTRHEGSTELQVDPVLDSSMWGLFAFGMYSAGDPRIRATFQALRQGLWIDTGVGGMARYENDAYHRASPRYPGNPWFISTLWLADFQVASAENEEELSGPMALLEWVADHALPSGVLAEQVHPESGEPLSVSPLTWSHATFVATTLRLLRRIVSLRHEGVVPTPGGFRGEDWLGRLYGEACEAIRGICRLD